jgi:DNA primase
MENTVATLGTALTADHIRLLKGFVGEVILVYDSDEGGMKAVLRNVGLFIREYVNAKIMVLPDGYDPDSYIFEFGPESFMEMASQAQGLIHFLIESAIEKHGISIEGKMRIVSDLQGPLASMDDSVTRSLFVKELAERIGIDEAAILEKIRGRVDGKADLPSSFQERGGRVERQIIAMMLQCPDTLPEIRKYDVLEYFEDSILKSIGETILHMNCSGDHASDIMEIVDDSEQKSIIASLLVDEVTWDDRVPSKEITRFVRTERKRREDMLMKKIKAAEEKNDYELLIRLLSEKHKMVVMNEKRKMDLLRRE